MIEVFKTNVQTEAEAEMLLKKIHLRFCHYKANFDLKDCDNILRVKCTGDCIETSILITMLDEAGFNAEILSESVPAI